MKFDIEKCSMLIMKWRKRQITKGIELPRKIKNARKKANLQVLRNIGSGHHQTSGDEREN